MKFNEHPTAGVLLDSFTEQIAILAKEEEVDVAQLLSSPEAQHAQRNIFSWARVIFTKQYQVSCDDLGKIPKKNFRRLTIVETDVLSDIEKKNMQAIQALRQKFSSRVEEVNPQAS